MRTCAQSSTSSAFNTPILSLPVSIQRSQKHGHSYPPRAQRQRSKVPPPLPRLSSWVKIPPSRPSPLMATSSAPPSFISPSYQLQSPSSSTTIHLPLDIPSITTSSPPLIYPSLLHPLSPSNAIPHDMCQLGFSYCTHAYCHPLLPLAQPPHSSTSTSNVSHAPLRASPPTTAPSSPLSSTDVSHALLPANPSTTPSSPLSSSSSLPASLVPPPLPHQPPLREESRACNSLPLPSTSVSHAPPLANPPTTIPTSPLLPPPPPPAPVPPLLHHQQQPVSEETRPRDSSPPYSTVHQERVSSTLLRFLTNYQDPRLVPYAPSPPLLPELPSPLPPLLTFEPPASCVWSTCVRPWWEKHIVHFLVYIYEDGYKYHPLAMELWLGVNSGVLCYDADEDFLERSGGRVTMILEHLFTYVSTIFPPCLLDTVHGRMKSFFEEVYALLNDLTAIRRHFWPLPFALLDYPLRGENLLPLNCPPNYQDAYRTVPTKMRDAFALEPRMNTYSADDDDYDDDASSWGTRSDGSDSSTHSYCSDDDWEECSSGADSFADHSSTDVPENPPGTHRLPGASDTCTTSNIHALVTAPANVSTGPRPATCNTTNIHALVTAPATVDTYTDKHALVTVFPRPQQTPCKYLIKAFQYIDLIEHDLFSECYTATAPTSIPIVPPPRPSSTHHYSRADELLMSARMISLHRHNIQLRTLTVLDQLSLPLHLHNSTYHPSLIPQAVSAIRPRRTSLRKQPTPLSFRTTTHTPHVQIPPPLASHERSTITVNALLSRYPLPRNPPPRSMTRRRASRSQRARTPSVPSYILATPPLRFYSTPQLTRPSTVPSRTVT